MDYRKIIFRSWKHHFLTNLATTTVLSLSFMVMAGLWLGSHNVSHLMNRWGEDIQLTVYLKDSATSPQTQAIEAAIRAQNGIENVQFIDKQKASETFKQSLASYGPNFLKALSEEGESPFPASFFVTFQTEQRNSANVEAAAKSLLTVDGVEDVAYGEEWINNYHSLLRIVRIITWVMAIALLTGTLFTVSNAIRASLSARREEIEILELVGATESSIRTPFVVEGAFQGFLASAVALVLLGLGYAILAGVLRANTATAGAAQSLVFFPWYGLTLVLAAGAGVGAIGSYLCVAHLNTGWAASQREGI